MKITRNRGDTQRAPSDWFTGAVWIDPLAAPPPPSRLRLLSVHFAPGALTNWHHHPFGQVLHVVEGKGLVQREGGPVEEIRAGDVVWFEPGERHWHGAGPSHFMTHVAIQEAADDGTAVEWGAPVSDSEYQA
jgi:quercetin dioxygenase-like cupin family protein